MSVSQGEVRPEKRIELYPFDVDAWNSLLREAQKKRIDEARAFYERLCSQFPNSGRFWKYYIEHELKARNYENVEKIFQRCLMKVLNIDLWKCYLSYVRDTKGHLPSFREKMAQAYDFALEKVGLDSLGHQMYSDYILFLRNVPAVGAYAENQKITAVRKIFQRAICTPLLNIETVWNEYCSFEKSVNAALAEKLIADRSKDYQNARRVSKTMETVMRGIHRNMISVPPRGSPSELKQVDLWKKYIVWEKTNPLGTEDFSMSAKRVVYAYEQAALCLGYYPDLWYEAALFMQDAAKTLGEKGDAKGVISMHDDISALYERATTTLLKDNMLLYFAYCDFEEERMKYDKVQSVYNRFIEIEDIDPTLAYIQYMKFARRTEGIKAARSIFKKAREDTRAKCHVYVAAALMEYYCSKETSIAFKIFELGLKKFGDNPDYAVAYIDFLSHLNEDNNTRVLFERILSGNLPQEKSLEIWDKYLEFESQVGDLVSITKVDKRRRAALQKEFASWQTLLLIDRYKFMDLYPCSKDEIKMLGYAKNFTNNPNLNVSSLIQNATAGPAEKHSNAASTAVSLRNDNTGVPMPDTSQMIPFKPRIIATNTSHPVAGGVFPPPPAVAHLLSILPPPVCFHGPFVMVDKIIEEFRKFQVPDEYSADVFPVDLGQEDPMAEAKLENVKKDMYQLLAATTDPLAILQSHTDAVTRKRLGGGGDSDDENHMDGYGMLHPPPTQDIYRLRQQHKKIKA